MFILDSVLERDTIELDRWPLSLVLLMNDATYPWLVLVPRRAAMRELHDLSATDRATLLDEIVRATRLLEAMCRPRKLNVAALGNMVAQLHVHVIARFEGDGAWPRPVWGVAPARPYAPEALTEFRRRFAEFAAA